MLLVLPIDEQYKVGIECISMARLRSTAGARIDLVCSNGPSGSSLWPISRSHATPQFIVANHAGITIAYPDHTFDMQMKVSESLESVNRRGEHESAKLAVMGFTRTNFDKRELRGRQRRMWMYQSRSFFDERSASVTWGRGDVLGPEDIQVRWSWTH